MRNRCATGSRAYLLIQISKPFLALEISQQTLRAFLNLSTINTLALFLPICLFTFSHFWGLCFVSNRGEDTRCVLALLTLNSNQFPKMVQLCFS
ncbi:hypothetical protein L211DRAFT_840343 [Terfezia boudieri ATCC MYA-4762]|uniref:Uncharacterized protein n=1 Tax=Terfezia boudieri ATCC MYA-4762 TaxID=1051890 RepID=A0A3N4LG61_9PEZI|nr:hypothetical protein L211DRAFT_840343 [Terfezia boudieri ATCC MYA-4762]